MPPPRGQQILEEEPTVCTKCELSFKSFADYHKHKAHSRRHIACEVCSQDFESHEACKQHHDLMHSHQQDMSCPGCNKHFTRLGGLMSHIELAECKYFQREIVEKNRKMKQNWYSNAQNARNFQDYGRTAGDFDNNSPSPFTAPQPHKLLRGPEGVMLVTADGEPVQDEASQSQALSRVSRSASPAPTFRGDDLMAFGELTTMPPAHLFTKPPSVLKQEDFSALTVKLGNVPNTPGVELKAGNAWDAKPKLFADAPATIAPPVELLRSMNVKDIEEGEVREEHPMDPDSRSFNAMKFYIDLIGKFRCPHRGCGKSIEHKGAFIQHLKSPAHRNEKLQCINCLRYFATATALTQHCESQGVRCKVRQTSEYDGVIDGITGGTAITAGRHVDDTIKYAVNPEILPTLTTASVVEAHRARLEEKNKKRQHFWDDRIARW